jgi:monoamine oxidase
VPPDAATVDVVVLGAGAAGLSAARALLEADIDVAVLEARERLGGRIWTHRDSETSVPIELGAEFIHGRAPELQRVLDEAGLSSTDISAAAGRPRRADFARWTTSGSASTA